MARPLIVLAFAAVFLAAALISVRKADDVIKKLVKSTGNATIKIIELRVPDLDPYPAQGDSDVFVRISLAGNNITICESPIVQDENKPKVSLV